MNRPKRRRRRKRIENQNSNSRTIAINSDTIDNILADLRDGHEWEKQELLDLGKWYDLNIDGGFVRSRTVWDLQDRVPVPQFDLSKVPSHLIDSVSELIHSEWNSTISK
tara:strand:- start:27 stop:353 length:327 start_codon:yes stop_codon:yes gene_type:complete